MIIKLFRSVGIEGVSPMLGADGMTSVGQRGDGRKAPLGIRIAKERHQTVSLQFRGISSLQRSVSAGKMSISPTD
jgi:hypothetical protein